MRSADCRTVFFSPVLKMWVITRYDEALAVLSDPRTFSSALAYQNAPNIDALTEEARALLDSVVPSATLHLTSADPPEHRRLRRVLEKQFSRAAMSQFEPTVCSIADSLIDQFVDRKEVDIVREFAVELPVQSIARLIGVSGEDLPQVWSWYRDWSELSLMFPSTERQVHLAGSVAAFQLHLRNLVERRRTTPENDLTSALIRDIGAEQTAVNELELVNMLAQLFATGTETTTSAMGTCLYRLLSDSRQWDRVRSPDARARIVEEGLRCNQAMRGLMRVAVRDAEIAGTTIPAGARLYVVNVAANRDPTVFDGGDRFNPDRAELNRHIAFGAGIHRCLGASLARIELGVAFERLSSRLPGLALVPDGVRLQTTPLVKSLGALRVRWS